jgi:hypothetical protein
VKGFIWVVWVALGFFYLALGPGQAWAQPREVIERVGNGFINWSQGVISAKGSGSPPKDSRNIAQARLMTERAALTDARRNLLEVLKGVRVDSVTRVENFVTKDDQIRLQAEGFIQGSVEMRKLRKYLSDGAIEVTVAIDLSGDFISLMLSASEEMRKKAVPPPPAGLAEAKPEKRVLRPPSPPALPVAKPGFPMEKKPEPPPPPAAPMVKEAKPIPPPPVSAPERKPEPPPPPAKIGEARLPDPVTLPPYTGMVIDTRGLKMKPALAIRILNEGGKELYRGEYVPQDKAARHGLALFARDLTAAQTNPRVGKNPLTIKGSKIDPASPSDIVLGQAEAQKMAPFAQKGTFLEDCRVMIVLD